MTYIIFDLETTGLDYSTANRDRPVSIHKADEVMQIGGLILNEEFQPIKRFCHCCDIICAECPPNISERVHHLYASEIRKYVPLQFLPDVMEQWLPEFWGSDVCFVGYNSRKFDYPMMEQGLRDYPIKLPLVKDECDLLFSSGRHHVDVIDFVGRRKLISFYKELTPIRASLMASRFWSEPESNAPALNLGLAHNALFDAVETYLLFCSKVLPSCGFGGLMPWER